MADLDDFFAKKDRKKANRKKFTTTDEIAKKLEETGKKAEKSNKKDKSTLSSPPVGTGEDDQGNQIQEDDEWKDFEEEKKDYTGLKIGNLQISELPDQNGEAEDEEEHVMEENEAGELVRRKVQSGPWKMAPQPQQQQQQQQQQFQEVPEPQVIQEIQQVQSQGPSRYKPPHLRSTAKESSHASPRSKKTAPDISDEKYFPSLSATKTGEPGRRKRDEGTFEEVRNSKAHSGRYSDAANKVSGVGGPKLNLGNKYGALSQDQDQS